MQILVIIHCKMDSCMRAMSETYNSNDVATCVFVGMIYFASCMSMLHVLQKSASSAKDRESSPPNCTDSGTSTVEISPTAAVLKIALSSN